MEYFKNGLKTVLGTSQPGSTPTGAETVERLVDRVISSTLLDDRRDACRALKALSKKYRVEVGAQGMDAFRQILELDRTDCEIIGYCLDTLCNITASEIFEEEQEHHQLSVNVGEQFTEMFIKNTDSVSLVLSFLEEYDFKVRWPAVKLLTNLLANKQKEIQEIVLVSPMGVSKLMDLLSDSREVIRNDVLLLLIQLTKSNANIQKIVAFENAFDRLFDVLKEEGYSDGGIVTEDCLLLMLNLLRNNTSNQNFFKEGSYIQRLVPMFAIPPDIEEEQGPGWSPQKVTNIHCVLEVVRTLVNPGNSAQVISSCQKTMRNCNLLVSLCDILMASGVPADVLTETINTVAEVIRGNLSNQEYFTNVLAPSNPPRPAIVVLLMSMVNEKQPFALRCAVLYCYQCFLYRNEIAQAQVIQTLLPSSTGSTILTTGQLLCGGMFNTDGVSNWFSSVALSHTLIENPAQKEQLLRVLLATNLGSPPVSLLQQCTTFLQQTAKLQSKIGLLMLLATWMAHCPMAVKTFINVPGGMAYLIAQTSANEHDENEELIQGLCAFLMGICISFNDDSVPSFSKENLVQVIDKRLGLETYISKLNDVSRHEIYSRAAKQPQIRAKQQSELLLEYEFCRLYKALEGIIIKSLGAQHDLNNGISELSLSEHENGLLLQYKELIREQDRKLQDLQAAINNLNVQNRVQQVQLEEALQSNRQLQDQNTLLKAQLSACATTDVVQNAVKPPTEDANLKQRLEQVENEKAEYAEDLDRLRKDQEDLLELLTDQDIKLEKFKLRLRQLGAPVDEEDSDAHSVDVEGSENDNESVETHTINILN